MNANPTPFSLGSEDGEALWFFGSLATFKATAEQTGGAFMLLEQLVPGGMATPLHVQPDDHESFYVMEGELTFYLEDGVLKANPFETLDRSGVGDLMQIAVERGRSVREDLKLGICGEHGGEPKSVAFCHELGLDYVSCSPYRVPLARLAAAQAALAESGVEAVSVGG